MCTYPAVPVHCRPCTRTLHSFGAGQPRVRMKLPLLSLLCSLPIKPTLERQGFTL